VKSRFLAAAAVLLPLAAFAQTVDLPINTMACLPQPQQDEIRARTEEIVTDAQKRRAVLPAIGPGHRVDEARRTVQDRRAELKTCMETAQLRKRGPEFCEKESVQLKVSEDRLRDFETGTASATAIDAEADRKLTALRAQFPACTGALSAQDTTAAGQSTQKK
jgi:hypothetical protein